MKLFIRKYGIYLALLIISMIIGTMIGAWFNQRYYLRSPFQSPIVKRQVSPIQKPKPSPKPITMTTDAILATARHTDSYYKLYIYQKESGVKTNAVNSYSGACGLGQAYPCEKMGCSLTDYACQDAYFDNYALQRYGGWEQAYNHWLVYKSW